MARVSFSKPAVQDFEQFLDYIEKSRPRAAIEVGEELILACERLSLSPQMGSSFAHWQTGLRGFSCKSFVNYFIAVPDGITVVRILHGAQDAESIFRGTMN
jgi:toxin ParE1/3/4